MRSKFLGFATVMMCSVTSYAMVSSYELPITRDGQTTAKVAYNFWSGEYPQPVINVHSEVAGTTTIQAFESLRSLDKPVTCTIKNSLYHPWGNSPSLINFYTLTAKSEYEAKKDIDGFEYDDENGVTQKVDLKAGAVLSRAVYLSEGYCQISIPVNGKQVDASLSCDQFSDPTLFEARVDSGVDEQWMYLQCEEGGKAFVGDDALLGQPGITPGQIGDYGTVKP